MQFIVMVAFFLKAAFRNLIFNAIFLFFFPKKPFINVAATESKCNAPFHYKKDGKFLPFPNRYPPNIQTLLENQVLRVILYVPNIEWYNDFQIHNGVMEALYPVILQHIVQDQKISKKIETEDTLSMDGFRLNYKFNHLDSKQTLLLCEKDFVFENEDDAKPSLKTSYKGVSIYPFQLLVSVNTDDDPNTIESYFTKNVE